MKTHKITNTNFYYCDVSFFLLELARDALHKTGLHEVVAGVMSPTHDAYKKKVGWMYIYLSNISAEFA